MRMLVKISKAIDQFTGKIASFVSWLVLIMIAVAVYNAFSRYAGRFAGMNLGSNFFLELQWYMFSLVFLLGASSALARNAHVRVDVISSKFTPLLRAKIDLAGGVILLLPFALFVISVSVPSVLSSWEVLEKSPDPGGIVRYPIKTLVPAAFLILFLQGVSEIIKSFLIINGMKIEAHPKNDAHGGGV